MDFIYRDLYYTIGYGCVVGTGNGLATLQNGSRFDYGFGEGFVNNFKLGIFLNALYPALFNSVSRLCFSKSIGTKKRDLGDFLISFLILLSSFLLLMDDPLQSISSFLCLECNKHGNPFPSPG